MTLDEAIQKLIKAGEKDPLDGARKLIKRHDEKWIASELVALAEDLITDRMRQQLASGRRKNELLLHPGAQGAKNEMMLRSFPIPGDGGFWEYKPFGRVTPEDLEARAAWYEKIALGSLRRAAWCRDVAGLIRVEGVATAGELAGDLPELPGDEELELPALRAA